MGFVMYIIWGFLLNNVLSHPYLKTENERIKIIIENLDKRLDEKQAELAAIVSKITNLTHSVLSLNDEITGKENDIIGYENGVIPVNIPSLRAAVGEFMGGWGAYTYGFFGQRGESLVAEAGIIKTDWLHNKITNLKPEYSNGSTN